MDPLARLSGLRPAASVSGGSDESPAFDATDDIRGGHDGRGWSGTACRLRPARAIGSARADVAGSGQLRANPRAIVRPVVMVVRRCRRLIASAPTLRLRSRPRINLASHRPFRSATRPRSRARSGVVQRRPRRAGACDVHAGAATRDVSTCATTGRAPTDTVGRQECAHHRIVGRRGRRPRGADWWKERRADRCRGGRWRRDAVGSAHTPRAALGAA